MEHNVTLTDTGSWLHAAGSDFVFAYLDNDWPPEVTQSVSAAFNDALRMPPIIKASVKQISGQDVVGGLYLLDEASMTEAMNTIDGMGLVEADREQAIGNGTAASIIAEFFSTMLGAGGDVTPMLAYLTQGMQNVQAQAKQSGVIDIFGTIIGMISVAPELDTPVTTFRYACVSQQYSKLFLEVDCNSVEGQSYDFVYTVADYTYTPPYD